MSSIIFFIRSNDFTKVSSKSHHFNLWQKIITHSIMANRISRVHTWKTEQKATCHGYQRKTKGMSWHGGYKFILECLIDVVLKSFWHHFSPLLHVWLVKDYLMQPDQALKYLYELINNTGWFIKSWMSSKSSAIQETDFSSICLTVNYVDLVL